METLRAGFFNSNYPLDTPLEAPCVNQVKTAAKRPTKSTTLPRTRPDTQLQIPDKLHVRGWID